MLRQEHAVAQKVTRKRIEIEGGVFSLDEDGRARVGAITKGMRRLEAALAASGDQELIELYNNSTFRYRDIRYDNGSEYSQAEAYYINGKQGSIAFYKDFSIRDQYMSNLTVFHEFRHLQTENYNMKTNRDWILAQDAPFEKDAWSWALKFNKQY